MGDRFIIAALCSLLTAAAPPLEFTPIRPDFEPSAALYRERWEEEGERIAAALERAAGVSFPAQPIEVLVRDGAPMTSMDGRTIRLRAGYSINVWRATMAHELGHRLAMVLGRSAGIDDHRALYLFYYEAMLDLYGQEFADRIVSMERRIPGPYDYDAAWTWALTMTREERQALLATLRPVRPVYGPTDAPR